MNYAPALAVAKDAALKAGQLLRDELHRAGGPRGSGGHAPADAEAEALIRHAIGEVFPQHGIIGEELPHLDRPPRDEEGHVWLIDPNDGTSYFTCGCRGSSVSIGLVRAGRPVLGVVYVFSAPDDRGELFAWAEGCGPLTVNGQAVARRPWAAELTSGHTVLVSLSAEENSAAWAKCVDPARFRGMAGLASRMAQVAAGRAEAVVTFNGPVGWDYAAGHALLLGAGGVFLDQAAQPIQYDRNGRSGARYAFGASPAVAAALARRDPPRGGRRAPADVCPFARLLPGQLIGDPCVLSRAQGCWLGQLAGDSLGSLVEFQSASSIRAVYPEGVRDLADGGCWDLIAGQPTDDSELALMLARSLVREGRFDPDEVAAAYVTWLESHPFDIGSTTRQALAGGARAAGHGVNVAEACRAAANPSSQANGALMRVSPLSIYGWSMRPVEVDRLARADAALTHPHLVCQDASALFAATLAQAIREGADAQATFTFAQEHAQRHVQSASVREALLAARQQPPMDFLSQQGWVLIALQNAFYQLLHAPNLESGLVDTVGRGGDTDTNGCIAGALLGAVHGRQTVPARWQDRILSCRPIAGLPGVHRPRPERFWPVDALVLAERLLLAGRELSVGH
ncbi:MAG TPA: inositol monophosphatase family protein [Verrucomicrobiota bacterium]|nr:inositol monophosphatase family protein [Verrucomicrobiota bacterium]